MPPPARRKTTAAPPSSRLHQRCTRMIVDADQVSVCTVHLAPCASVRKCIPTEDASLFPQHTAHAEKQRSATHRAILIPDPSHMSGRTGNARACSPSPRAATTTTTNESEIARRHQPRLDAAYTSTSKSQRPDASATHRAQPHDGTTTAQPLTPSHRPAHRPRGIATRHALFARAHGTCTLVACAMHNFMPHEPVARGFFAFALLINR